MEKTVKPEVTTVKHKAAWTLSQILSWVIPILLALVMWVLWFTDSFSLTGAIVLSVILTIMGVFFLVTNTRLKRNSALTAVMDNDDKHTLLVFQHKPRAYWNGKLDVAKNKAAISKVRSINFADSEGIPYVLMSYNDSNNTSRALVIPFRILVQDKVRMYVAEGMKDTKNIKYRNDEDKERFVTLLTEGRDITAEV